MPSISKVSLNSIAFSRLARYTFSPPQSYIHTASLPLIPRATAPIWALKTEVASLLTNQVVSEAVKGFVADKEYLNKFIVSLAGQWVANEPIVISTADAEGLKKYFAANAKAVLDKGVKIEQVNGSKTLFSISPADGSYKVNFGEEEFENYFKDFLRPQLVEMLF